MQIQEETKVSKTEQTSKSSTSNWRSQVKAPEKDLRIKTADVTKTKGHEFEDYSLKESIMMGIVEKGFEKPSPIQEECIPVALAGKDVIARSKNGTGKTAAYIIPILEKINKALNHVQALVLVPTRELALQTVSVIKQLGKYLEIQVMSSTGGAGFADDVLRLGQVVHILVGTPGRILDLVNKKVADFSKTEILVLDEADKLLSFDFKPIIEDIRYNAILQRGPTNYALFGHLPDLVKVL